MVKIDIEMKALKKKNRHEMDDLILSLMKRQREEEDNLEKKREMKMIELRKLQSHTNKARNS